MLRSTEIYQVYLKYVVPEDIHVYSIDSSYVRCSFIAAFILPRKERKMYKISKAYQHVQAMRSGLQYPPVNPEDDPV